MIRYLLSTLLFSVIYAFDCDVKQIHIAQGMDSTSMTISWLTIDNCFSHVAYGKYNNSLDYFVQGSSSNYEFYYDKSGSYNYYKSGYIHHVLITELEPSTQYYYKCGDFTLQSSSQILYFKTLPKAGDNKLTTFGILGDIGLKLVKDVERLGFGLDKFKESRYQDCEYVLFATNAVEQSILGKDNYSFPSLEAILKNIEKCKNRKKFQNWLTKAEISLQSAIFNLVQMAICIKNNDYKFRIYLDDAIRDSGRSISSRHEYYGMRREIVADSVMDHQMGLIINALEKHDSWNIEIET